MFAMQDVIGGGRSRHRVLRSLLLLACACLLREPLGAQVMTQNIIFVHADLGDDGNDGTARHPVKTLNEALKRADALVHQPGFPQDAKIRVYQSATPIAPVDFGGFEDEGWYAPGAPPFPLVMVEGVDVTGIPDGADKPRIAIVETLTEHYPWPPGPRCLVLGASHCALRKFTVDGTDLEVKQFPPPLPPVYGIIAIDTADFDLEDCHVLEQHDGVRYFATANNVCTGTLTDCLLSDFYPVLDTSANELKNEGHAGLWLEGENEGTVEVTVVHCDFQRSHDGIEIGGPNPGDLFQAILTVMSDTEFRDNENGIEVVGQGALQVLIDDTTFIDNYNGKPGPNGVAPGAPISCVWIGGMRVRGCIRNSHFENFSIAVTYRPFDGFLGSCLDLGRQDAMPICFPGDPPGDSPGNNVFVVVPAAWDPNIIPVKTALWNMWMASGPPVFPHVTAWANQWLPLNQGADGQGCLLGLESGIVTVPPYASGPTVDRNFGIDSTFTGIDFGTTCGPP